LLTLSSIARCLASNDAAWLEPALLLPKSENGKNPFEAGWAGAAAAGGDGGAPDPGEVDPAVEPALGRGAGNRTSSATADAVAKTTHAIANKIARAPDPVITLSPCLGHVRLTKRLFAKRYGEFAAGASPIA